MAFFSKKKLRRIKIEVDPSAVKSDSPEVVKRLERIDANYDRLNEILSNLELKFQEDSQFVQWLGDSDVEIPIEETKTKKRKRKWRPRKPR